jgi:DNA-binding FadR family transcriptional regulator
MRETLRIPGRPGRSLKSHRQILAAIESRDPVAARETMLSHMQGLEDAILGLA